MNFNNYSVKDRDKGEIFIKNLINIYDELKGKLEQGVSEKNIKLNLSKKGIICHTEANPLNHKEYAEYIKNSVNSFEEIYQMDINKGFNILGKILSRDGSEGYCIDAKLRQLTEAIDKNRSISVKNVENITSVYNERLRNLLKDRIHYPYNNYLEFVYMNNIDKIFESFKLDPIIKYLLNENIINIHKNKTNKLIGKNRTSLKDYFYGVKEMIEMDNNEFLVSLNNDYEYLKLPKNNVYNNLYNQYITVQDYSILFPFDLVPILLDYNVIKGLPLGSKLIGKNNNHYILLEDILSINNIHKEIKTDYGFIKLNSIDSLQIPGTLKNLFIKSYLDLYKYIPINKYINKTYKIPKNTIVFDNAGIKYKILNNYEINKVNNKIKTDKGTFDYIPIQLIKNNRLEESKKVNATKKKNIESNNEINIFPLRINNNNNNENNNKIIENNNYESNYEYNSN